MSTTVVSIIAGAVVLGIALWKGKKILVSKNDNGDYQLEIKSLKEKVRLLDESIKFHYDKVAELKSHINTKGMNMKKLRAITKKNA